MEEVEVQDILEKLGLDIPHPAPDSKEQREEAYLCSFSAQHQSPPLSLQKKDYLPLKRFFHSFQELERKTSRAGFECMCCPQKDCPVFIGVERLTHYYPYSTNPNMVFPMYHERCKGSSRNVNAVNSSNSACPPAKRICTDVTSIVKETYAKSSNGRTHHLQTTIKTCGIKFKIYPSNLTDMHHPADFMIQCGKTSVSILSLLFGRTQTGSIFLLRLGDWCTDLKITIKWQNTDRIDSPLDVWGLRHRPQVCNDCFISSTW